MEKQNLNSLSLLTVQCSINLGTLHSHLFKANSVYIWQNYALFYFPNSKSFGEKRLEISRRNTLEKGIKRAKTCQSISKEAVWEYLV